jgi:hypothetical protein
MLAEIKADIKPDWEELKRMMNATQEMIDANTKAMQEKMES